MKKHLVILIGALTIAGSAHAAYHPRLLGGTVGNGGDSVQCKASPDNAFVGYHSTDFLLTLKEDNSDLVQFATWPQYRDRLLAIFDAKYPDFGILFRDFLARLPGESATPPDQVYLQQRIWLEAVYGLVDIKDEQIVRRLPPNCRTKMSSSGDPQLTQTVIRQRNGDAIIYNFDPAVLRELRKNPLQYSFLVVHEWLWDYIKDPEVIRRVNRFLHSDYMERLPADEVRLSLENLGLTLKFSEFVPVCERTPKVRQAIERGLKMTCVDITKDRLWGNFSNSGLTTLRPGDLSGMGSYKDIWLDGNQLSLLLTDTFYGLFGLETLHLGQNLLKVFPMDALENMPLLTRLELNKNQLTEFDTGDRALPPLKEVNLSDNRLRVFPSALVANANLLETLLLTNNQIRSVTAADVAPFNVDGRCRRMGCYMDLSGNQIETVPPGVFPMAVSDSRGFRLAGNRLTRLPDPPSGGLPDDVSFDIDLRNNQIADLPASWVRALCPRLFEKSVKLLLKGNPILLSVEQRAALECICSATWQTVNGIKRCQGFSIELQ